MTECEAECRLRWASPCERHQQSHKLTLIMPKLLFYFKKRRLWCHFCFCFAEGSQLLCRTAVFVTSPSRSQNCFPHWAVGLQQLRKHGSANIFTRHLSEADPGLWPPQERDYFSLAGIDTVSAKKKLTLYFSATLLFLQKREPQRKKWVF